MELINKLEKIVLGWVKNVPHLPVAGQKWLAANVWWIALVGAVISGISALFALVSVFSLAAFIGSVANTYYVVDPYSGFAVVKAIISLGFLVLSGAILAFSVKPLQNRQKKGWVLLFLSWLVSVVSVVISAVLSFSVFGFIAGLLFGGIFLAAAGYFILEIHAQFAHVKTTKHKTV